MLESAAEAGILEMTVSPKENAPDGEPLPFSEFDMPRWSVITSDECAASNLSYADAVRLVAQMSQKSHGLCIVTDEAAGKMRGAAENGSHSKTENQPEDLSQKTFQEIL